MASLSLPVRHSGQRQRQTTRRAKLSSSKSNLMPTILASCLIYGMLVLYLWVNFSFLSRSSPWGNGNKKKSSPSDIPINNITPIDHNQNTTKTNWRHNNTDDLKSRFDWDREQVTKGGAFVHIGKTGGSSLSVLLRNGCHSWLKHPCRSVPNETSASLLIESYYHVPDFGLLPESDHDFYLLTLRDPYDRTISSFVYEHYANVQARGDVANVKKSVRKDVERACQECFATLEQFVSRLRGSKQKNASPQDDDDEDDSEQFTYPYGKNEIVYQDNCLNFTRAVFHGRVRIFHHLFFNYRRIRSLITSVKQKEPEVLATRLEYLWNDWAAVNAYLKQHYTEPVVLSPLKASNTHPEEKVGQQPHGQEPRLELANQHVRNTAHFKLPVTRELSSAGQEILCQALQPEYDAYFWLLSRARNLVKDDLVQSLITAKQKCPSVSIDFKALKRDQR